LAFLDYEHEVNKFSEGQIAYYNRRQQHVKPNNLPEGAQTARSSGKRRVGKKGTKYSGRVAESRQPFEK
jgi:hypothetical protein